MRKISKKPWHCPNCRHEFKTKTALDLHFDDDVECGAYALDLLANIRTHNWSGVDKKMSDSRYAQKGRVAKEI